jgi:nucleoside-diphosphate-sugar epimerase
VSTPVPSAATALVTGGSGFLGKAIVHRLVARGCEVRSLCRRDDPALRALGVETIRGDVADPEAVLAAACGCDVVFHVAAKTGTWGSCRAYEATNVRGTDNVIAACRKHGIAKLVYTSTPSVIYGGRDIQGADESLPYPTRYQAHYPRTKALAEQRVLAANDAALSTVALRPHLIWGPGDNQLIPRIVARAKAGTLRLVGDGSKRVDSVYIDNAADAHLLAFDRLRPGAACAGKVYFITQGEPLPVGELVNRILATAGLPPIRRSIPPRAAYVLGWLCELAYTVLRVDDEPPMTRFLAQQLATAHWFDISAARRDLGYTPAVSIAAGLQRLAAWLSTSATP